MQVQKLIPPIVQHKVFSVIVGKVLSFWIKRLVFICFPLGALFTLAPEPLYSQSVLDDIQSQDSFRSSREYIHESLLRISPSRRIYLISNTNNAIATGDFITLFQNDLPIFRALVAKLSDKVAGIKIVKVYSLKRWEGVRKGQKIQIIRGDDTAFLDLLQKKKKESEQSDQDKEDESNAIVTEDDLFSETKIEGDVLEEKGNRIIKTDNIVGAFYGVIPAINTEGETKNYASLGVHWAYQLADNIYGEAIFAQTKLSSFPGDDINTTINSLFIRAKYVINAPFYSFILPYIGFQMRSVSSPNAGQQSSENSLSQAEIDRENELVEEVEKNSVIIGVTILKRLVPGWFLKSSLGTDTFNIGFAIEF